MLLSVSAPLLARNRRSWIGPFALLAVLGLGLLPSPKARAETGEWVATVPQCSPKIKLTASYLAPMTGDSGPGFYFELYNQTDHPITLIAPVPSSAHWYAHVGRRWLWRASAGSSGSLVNALSPNGPVFVYRKYREGNQLPDLMTLPAHGMHSWTAWSGTDPAIAYQPSCAHCNYPGEHEFRAVFAYAWLPAPGVSIPGLLACGLRSNPVIMPPFIKQHDATLDRDRSR